jgi:V/A-type H+-transporting ATPase subunit D
MNRPPTRDQLLSLRRQIVVVQYGKLLLEKKRDAILRAIEEDRRLFRELERRFQDLCTQLSFAYSLVRIFDGHFALRVLKPVMPPLEIHSTIHVLMGCRYPQFESPYRGLAAESEGLAYDPALASLNLDDLLRLIEEGKPMIWEFINKKAKLQALERELKRTLQKINTLEHVLLPSLKKDLKRIRETLAERERQELFTVKRLRTKALRKQETGRAGKTPS